ncbi:hypothetical protein Tco_1499226 [Tanacetum coccineum]
MNFARYVPESNSKEDPVNGGDDGDDEDELSDDDEDDDVDIEEDEEEEEHPAPVDSTAVALPAIARLLAIPSPLSLWSSPLPQIPSPPLLVSLPSHVSPPPLPNSPTYPLGYRAAMIRLRAEAPSTSHPLPLPSPIAPPSGTPPLLPIPLPTPSPPLLLPSTDHRAVFVRLAYRLERGYALPLVPDMRDYGFIATLDDEIMRDPERDVGYGIIDTWDEMLVGMPGAPATDETRRCPRRGLGDGPMDASDLHARRSWHLSYPGGTQQFQEDHRVREQQTAKRQTPVNRGPKIDEDNTNTVDSTSESTKTS